MTSTSAYQAPKKWLRVSKYLVPVGIKSSGWRRTKPPHEQVSVAQLATDHPESLLLHTQGKAELLPEYEYECYTSGEQAQHRLPAQFAAPAYVAQLHNGLSFGRHCCVIGPAGKAVRETGFNLDSEPFPGNKWLRPYRLRYWRYRWEGDVTSHPWMPLKQRIDGSVAVLNMRWSHNFYHWLVEILPRLATLRRAGLQADYYMVDCLTSFQQEVLASLGIEAHQLIQPHCRLLLEAEQLFVPSHPTPACLRAFGTMLSAGLGIDGDVPSPRRIFISRRKTGTRTLENEEALEKLLHAQGFETHAMEEYPLAKQARLIRESEIIVATHGAGLANLVFARPETRVIEIVPAGRYNAACYPEMSCILGLHHQQIFAKSTRYKKVLHVSLKDVMTALSQAERPAYRQAAA